MFVGRKEIRLIGVKRAYGSPCNMALWEWTCQVIATLGSQANTYDIFRKLRLLTLWLSILPALFLSPQDSFPFSTDFPL